MTRRFARKLLSFRFVAVFISTFSVLALLAAPATAQNPVPFIDQPLVPDATAPGGAAFTLTLNGAGFVVSSTVNWNGSPLDTTFVSSSQLTATVPASDIAAASTASVAVVSPGPGGGVSNIQYFSIAASVTSVSFQPAVTYPSGPGGGYSMAVADVNGDGKLDLLVVNGGSGNDLVSVLLGNGDGTFQAPVSYDAGGQQTISVAVADLNGDGKPDLVVVNSVSLTVGVLRGNGDGTFQPVVTYSAGGSPWSVAVADVNGDGNPDILVGDASSCYGCSAGGLVGVLLGNGDGTFQPVVTYSSGGYSFETSPTAIAAADLNGDGQLDVVMTNACFDKCSSADTKGGVGVLLGNGDGTFQPAVIYRSGGYGPSIGALAIADVNRDGKPDLIVANSNSVSTGSSGLGTIGVLLGNGDGTFQPAVVYASGAYSAASVVVADVNGDGEPDLVVTNFCSISSGGNCATDQAGVVGLLLGNRHGTFQPAVTYSLDGYWGAFSTAVADIDGDGRPDLLALNFWGTENESSVNVLLNGSSSSQSATTTMLSSSLNPSNYGDTVTLTAAVTSSSGTPTGIVIFSDTTTSTTLGSATLADGSAAISVSSLGVGSHSIVAAYQGSSSFGRSTSLFLNQLVNGITTTSLASLPNPSVFGQSVTFTVAVSAASGTPTGWVFFYDGSAQIGAATLASGTESISVSALAAGSHSITAAYQGSGAFKPSTSAPLNQVVTPAATTSALMSSANPVRLKQRVTYTAILGSQYGGLTTGTVSFRDGGVTVATVGVSGNQASCTTSYSVAGIHSISATYSGDANDVGSTSALLMEQARDGRFPSETALATSGSPSFVGQPVTLTATVTSIYGAIPDGDSVTFRDDGAVIGTTTTAGGIATFTTSSLTARTHTLKATYAGDEEFAQSSRTTAQVVGKYATTTALVASLNPSVYGQSVTWTATVTSAGPNIPTGSVRFVGLGYATLSGGVATFTKAWLKAGNYAITAEYEGDSASTASASSVLNQVVNPASTTTVITSSADPSTSGKMLGLRRP
jgi:Bacterial Ig-like domain (group 3)/FG-GAP-like repeat